MWFTHSHSHMRLCMERKIHHITFFCVHFFALCVTEAWYRNSGKNIFERILYPHTRPTAENIFNMCKYDFFHRFFKAAIICNPKKWFFWYFCNSHRAIKILLYTYMYIFAVYKQLEVSLYWVSQRIIMWIYFSFFYYLSGKAKTVKTFRMCALGQRLHEKLEAKTKLKGKKSKIAQEIRNDWRSVWNCAWFYYCLVCYKNLFIFLLFLILYFRCFLWFTCFASSEKFAHDFFLLSSITFRCVYLFHMNIYMNVCAMWSDDDTHKNITYYFILTQCQLKFYKKPNPKKMIPKTIDDSKRIYMGVCVACQISWFGKCCIAYTSLIFKLFARFHTFSSSNVRISFTQFLYFSHSFQFLLSSYSVLFVSTRIA